MSMSFDPRHFVQPEIRMPAYAGSESDRRFLQLLTAALREGEVSSTQVDGLFRETSFPQRYRRLVLVLYAPGMKRILITRAAEGPYMLFSGVFSRLLRHSRRDEFRDRPFRLQMDFVVDPPQDVDLFAIGMSVAGERHFEIGVDGLMFHGPDGKLQLFLPGDGYVRSVMSMNQLREYLFKAWGEDYVRAARFTRFTSTSWISSSAGEWRRLYRGHPLVGPLDEEKIGRAVAAAVDHIQYTQQDDGRFLYYYDAARDSRWDHEHPKRHPNKNPYYNILRHGGGALTCLYYERHFRNGRSLDNIRRGIDYLLSQTRSYECEGREAAYVYSERKAKLGGAGIALYLLADFQHLTGDRSYSEWMHKIAWHLLQQITASGEFIYYNVYLDKPVSEADNVNYFSFYYPGEAVCGLARYYPFAPPELQAMLVERLRRALHFLLHVRPQTRAEHYTAVPSDSWLMMGIMELWDIEEMRDPDYARFVFEDADKMVAHMYKVTDAPYPDYAGAFYYAFGDYPYADGARLEGLMGAYALAVKLGDRERMRRLWPALRLGAWAVMHLVNSEDSLYFAQRPDLALGGIRFKYTRQWFRIDTIQHVASFYAKLLPYWEAGEAEWGQG